ncbi:MAG: response regulator [Magnetococcales bacterium]|nr:response regulator [Magnetococcales bacterium]
MRKDKILVIDDEQLIFDSIEDTLADDYELYHAPNGAIGLQMLEQHRPILVILDIRMPVMDGFEFLQKAGISADDPYSVIVLSGHAAGSEVSACYDMGITAFLRKPFNIFELKGLVKQCISAKKQYQVLLHEKQYIRALFDYSMDLIIAIDSAFNIVDLNPTAETLFGMTSGELKGTPFKNLFAHDAQFEAVEALLCSGQPFSDALFLCDSSGEHCSVVLKFAVLHDESGNPIDAVEEGEKHRWERASILLSFAGQER